MDRSRLEAAAAAGLLSEEQVEPLLTFLEGDGSVPAETSEEQLRFVRSFGDIFIALGVVFVAASSALLELAGFYLLLPIAGLALVAEWLVRVRRLALPGIAILLAILYFVSEFWSSATPVVAQALTLSAVAGLFYWRHGMPFSLLPLAGGLVAALLIAIKPEAGFLPLAVALAGLMVFVVAMAFDVRDRARSTRLSDCAFWLHLLAAPLIVHGVMWETLRGVGGDRTLVAMLIAAFFLAFFLLALWVDRRALLVSSLAYGIFAVLSLLMTSPRVIKADLPAYVLLGFGVFVLVSGAYWYKARTRIFGGLRNAAIARFVPGF